MFSYRDSLIDHLHHENGRQRQELQRLLNEHQNIVGDLRSRILELESILSAKVFFFIIFLLL